MKQTLCLPRKPKRPGICYREPDEGLESYDNVIDDYICYYRDSAKAERQFFKDCSLQKAIRYAGRWIGPMANNGAGSGPILRRHPITRVHQ
jgi:hypothetical protein